MLKSWQDSGDLVSLILSGSDINDAFLIEGVTEILQEADQDVGLSVTLREYKLKSELAKLAGGWDSPVIRQDERVTPQTYTVVKGDMLWDIACRFCGDETRWGEIAAKNGVINPRTLQIGTVITL